MARLIAAEVACWVLKSTRAPEEIDPDWSTDDSRDLVRCVRRSYRLELMSPGQPCLLWVSGRHRPGVHALGELTATPAAGDGGPEVAVRWTRLAEPVDRAELLADPRANGAEVLRMPAGSNPSWLSAAGYAAVLAHAGISVPPPRFPPPQPGLGR